MANEPLVSPTPEQLATILPGTWNVRATNFPMWLSGNRESPTFTYGVLSADPLALSDDVAWFTSAGREKHLRGVDRWHGDGFIWRGAGLLKLVTSHWTVTAISADQTVAVVRFSKSIFTPAGVDVIVRDGVDPADSRATVARSAKEFGLSTAEFASLVWLDEKAPLS